jgi:hypothetical protein
MTGHAQDACVLAIGVDVGGQDARRVRRLKISEPTTSALLAVPERIRASATVSA